MPIVNLPENPPTPPEPQRDPVQVMSPDYRHSLVDAAQTPLTAMVSHIEGYPWPGDYYSQVVAGDEELSPFQPGQMTPYQQYHVIHGYQQKLQSPLSISIDPETQVVTASGTSRMWPGLKPNKGDAWVADIGDGRAGQFTVTKAVPLTYFKDTAYEIELELSRIATKDVIDALQQRVVKESHFVADFLVYGQNPIIANDALLAMEQLTQKLRELQNDWFTLFFSNEFRTQLVPGQGQPTYDPFVTKAMLSIHSMSEHPNVGRIIQLNVDDLNQANQPSIWDALLRVDKYQLGLAFKEPLIVGSDMFNQFPFFKSVRWSGVQRVVVAREPLATVDRDYQEPIFLPGSPYLDLQDMKISLASAIYQNAFNEFHYPGEADPAGTVFFEDEVPLIHPIAFHGGYVVSKHFYEDNVSAMSKLDVLVKQFLDNGGEVNRDVLFAMAVSTRQWGRLERYYYIPLLIIMLKASLRRI